MRFSTALREYPRKRIEKIDKADMVVGVPGYNNENTIAHVIKTAAKGIDEHFHCLRGLIVVADGGSTDDTREMAREEQLAPYIEKIVEIYRGIPGKGSALRSILESAYFLQAKACIVCDADLRSINTLWIKNLATPIIENEYDLVTPLYTRHKYDGTITNNIVYNLTRALYGKRVRQPIGGDFAFSRRMIKFFLEQDVWETDVARYGVDIWLTTSAITQNLRLCQSRLGVKIHDEKDPGESLGAMFRQVTMTMFTLMEKYYDTWVNVKSSVPVDTVGAASDEEPMPIQIDYERLIENFKVGFDHFGTLWKDVVSRENFIRIKDIYSQPSEKFTFSVDTWAKILYDFAATFHHWQKDRYKLIDVMTPLYYGRIASFINQTRDMSNNEAEIIVEEQAEHFEEMKPYLIKIWGKKE